MRSTHSRIGAAVLLALVGAGCSPGTAPEREGGPATGELERAGGTYVNPDSAALSPDGSRIAVPCDGSICVWDTTDGTLTDTWDGGSVLAWSPAGSMLATDGGDGETVTFALIDTSTGEEMSASESHSREAVEDQPGGGILDLEFSPNARGPILARVCDDGAVRLWSFNDMGELVDMDVEGEKPLAVAFSPDGSRLAVASSDAPVTIHDAATGAKVGALSAEPQGAVVWSADGTHIATASFALDDDAATTIWDAERLTSVARLPRAADEIAFASTSDRLALSVKNETEVLVWDWATEEVSTLAGATDAPRAVLWAPDASVLYAVSARDAVLAWDPTGGEPMRFETPRQD